MPHQEREAFFTYKRRPILTLVEDHSPGVHDVVLPACDKYRYLADGFKDYHDSCSDSLATELDSVQFPSPRVTPQPLNLWMNCPISSDGVIDYLPPTTKPGDRAAFKAETDCVVAFAACPYNLADRNMPVNGPNGQPMEVHYELWRWIEEVANPSTGCHVRRMGQRRSSMLKYSEFLIFAPL